METMMLAAGIVDPMALIMFILIPTIAIGFARGSALTAGRLLRGYAGALLVLAVVVAAVSYVSPERALSAWKVQPEHYYGVLIKQFVSMFVLAAFMAVLGISVVGVPTLVALFKAGRATTPWLIVASVVISVTIALAASAAVSGNITPKSSSTELFQLLGFLVVSHGVLAAGFGIGARLPWAGRNAA